MHGIALAIFGGSAFWASRALFRDSHIADDCRLHQVRPEHIMAGVLGYLLAARMVFTGWGDPTFTI